MTLPEKLLWARLRNLDLNFRRQCPIGRYVADFACHAARLVVEVDSARHDLPEEQLHDAERTAWLEAQGYRVIRFRNNEVVNDLNGVVDSILATVPPRAPSSGASACSTPSPTLPPSRGKGELF